MVLRFRKIAATLLGIGMTVQIVTGILWILCQFPAGLSFPESEYLLSVSETFVMDEYTGPLYPALIAGCRLITGVCGLPFAWLLYLLQIAAAFFSYKVFLGTLLKNTEAQKWQVYFGSLYLMTVPLCVSWHVSLLPDSFLASAFLLLLAACISAARKEREDTRKDSLTVGILWAVMILLCPDGLWLGLPAICCLLFWRIRRKNRKLTITAAVLFLVFALAGVGINTAVQTPGSSGKIQRSLGASMVSRFVWPHFETNYFFWPEEVKEQMSIVDAWYISLYSQEVQEKFGPMIEEAYGRERAEELYLEMAKSCLQIRTREVLSEIGEDFKAYLLTPWQVLTQFRGEGLSFSGWNYEKMRSSYPKLSRWYMEYGLVSFRILFVLSAVSLIPGAVWKKENKKENKKSRFWGVLPVIGAGVLWPALWYTMIGAGLMDYRNVMTGILLWYCVIIAAWSRMECCGIRTEDDRDES